MNAHRRRPARARTAPILLALSLPLGACAATKDADMPPSTDPAPSAPSAGEPVMNFPYRQPRPVGPGLTLVYTGPEGGDAKFEVAGATSADQFFSLDMGQTHTIAGYRIRLAAKHADSVDAAVTDPDGTPLT
jgi:hypothetical protein